MSQKFKASRRRTTAIASDPEENATGLTRPYEDTLKRRKFHSANRAVMARFSSHWQEKNKSRSEDFLPRSVRPVLRYGKEALRSPTSWPKRNIQNLVERSTQVEIRPQTRNALVHCKVPTRDMTSQTRPAPPMPAAPTSPDMADMEAQTPTLQDPSLSQHDIDRLVQSIEPVMGNIKASSAAAADAKHLVKKLKQSQDSLAAKLNVVVSMTEDIVGREDQLMTAVRDCSDKCEPCPGPHVSAEAIHEIPERLNDITDIIEEKMITIEDYERLTEELTHRLDGLTETVGLLKEQQYGIVAAVEENKMDYEPFKQQEQRLTNIADMLEEVYKYTKVSEAANKEKADLSKVAEVDACTCVKGLEMTGEVNRELCQRCTNNNRGVRFLENNSLPVKDDVVTNRIGKIIECIEKDADGTLRIILDRFKKEASSWDPDKTRTCLGSLFQMALLWDSPNCSMVLADDVDATAPRTKSVDETGTTKRRTLGQYIKRAIDVKNTAVVRKILQRMRTSSRAELINSALNGSEGTTYLIFESARVCDLETFSLLVTDGADLDLREKSNRTILHELVYLSSTNTENNSFAEKTKAISDMLDLIYKEAGVWWDRRQNTGGVQANRASCTTAVRYLFQQEDAHGRNVFQYAAEVGSCEIFQKILRNPPYHFISDPVNFGVESGKEAYIANELDGCFVGQSRSILETVIRRRDGSDIVALEPLRSMLSDKWSRFQIFYWMWFFAYLIYMAIFTACAICRPIGATSIGQMYQDTGDYVRAVGETFVCLGLPFFFYGEVSDYKRNGWIWPMPWTRQGSFRLTNISFIVMVLLTYVLRLALTPTEDVCLCIALFLGWIMTTQFMVPSLYSGIFPVVMFEVFIGDFLRRFLWVFGLVLAATGTATFCAFQGAVFPDGMENPHESFWGSIFSTFKLTFGLLETDYVTKARSPAIGVMLFLVYIWLGHLLLLNLMIAMMVDTYSLTRQRQKEEWLLTMGCFAMLMDRRLPNSMCIQYDGRSHKVKQLRMGGMGKYLYSRTRLMYVTRLRERLATNGAHIQEVERIVMIP